MQIKKIIAATTAVSIFALSGCGSNAYNGRRVTNYVTTTRTDVTSTKAPGFSTNKIRNTVNAPVTTAPNAISTERPLSAMRDYYYDDDFRIGDRDGYYRRNAVNNASRVSNTFNNGTTTTGNGYTGINPTTGRVNTTTGITPGTTGFNTVTGTHNINTRGLTNSIYNTGALTGTNRVATVSPTPAATVSPAPTATAKPMTTAKPKAASPAAAKPAEKAPAAAKVQTKANTAAPKAAVTQAAPQAINNQASVTQNVKATQAGLNTGAVSNPMTINPAVNPAGAPNTTGLVNNVYTNGGVNGLNANLPKRTYAGAVSGQYPGIDESNYFGADMPIYGTSRNVDFNERVRLSNIRAMAEIKANGRTRYSEIYNNADAANRPYGVTALNSGTAALNQGSPYYSAIASNTDTSLDTGVSGLRSVRSVRNTDNTATNDTTDNMVSRVRSRALSETAANDTSSDTVRSTRTTRANRAALLNSADRATDIVTERTDFGRTDNDNVRTRRERNEDSDTRTERRERRRARIQRSADEVNDANADTSRSPLRNSLRNGGAGTRTIEKGTILKGTITNGTITNATITDLEIDSDNPSGTIQNVDKNNLNGQ